MPKDFDKSIRQETALKFRPASAVEMKALGDDIPDGYIAGWASTPEIDHYGHVVVPGAFDDSIETRGLMGPKGIKLLNQHNASQPAGVIKVLETRGGSLWIEAQLNLNISYVRDTYEAAKMVEGLSFSVGFFIEEYEWKQTVDKVEFLQINKGDLIEVSVVTFPGQENAEMTFIKSQECPLETFSDFEKALMAAGIVKSRNDAQRVTRIVKRLPEYRKDDTPPVQVSDKAVKGLMDALDAFNNAMKA